MVLGQSRILVRGGVDGGEKKEACPATKGDFSFTGTRGGIGGSGLSASVSAATLSGLASIAGGGISALLEELLSATALAVNGAGSVAVCA